MLQARLVGTAAVGAAAFGALCALAALDQAWAAHLAGGQVAAGSLSGPCFAAAAILGVIAAVAGATRTARPRVVAALSAIGASVAALGAFMAEAERTMLPVFANPCGSVPPPVVVPQAALSHLGGAVVPGLIAAAFLGANLVVELKGYRLLTPARDHSTRLLRGSLALALLVLIGTFSVLNSPSSPPPPTGPPPSAAFAC